MATVAPPTEHVAHIGETAGVVWATLNDLGPTSMTKLAKLIDAPPNVVQQAIGWLAREDKVEIEQQGRTRMICLKDELG